MKAKYDQNRYGETSQDNPALSWHWDLAAKWDIEFPCPPGSHWAPWESVWIKDGVSPRITDPEAVERYLHVFMELPPIVVQRGTYALIDGRHRLETCPRAIKELIRIREVDIADEDLATEAFISNLTHGKPYTTSERTQGVRRLLAHPKYAAMSNNSLASLTGLDPETVGKYRRQLGATQERRQGLDGRSVNVSKLTANPTTRKSDSGPLRQEHATATESDWSDDPDLSAEERENWDRQFAAAQRFKAKGRLVSTFAPEPEHNPDRDFDVPEPDIEQWEGIDLGRVVALVEELVAIAVPPWQLWMALSVGQQLTIGDSLEGAITLLEGLRHERG